MWSWNCVVDQELEQEVMPRLINDATESTCTLCLRTLPVDAFYLVNTRDAITSRCMECIKKVQLSRYYENKASGRLTPAMMRENSLRRRYSLTTEEYETMLQKQDFKCAICRRSESCFKKRLHVDHDHTTGKVRDLLCPACNRLVGTLEKNPSIFDDVRSYVDRHLGLS